MTSTLYSERFRRFLGKRDQVVYAEMAHYYPCCDIPTLNRCRQCFQDMSFDVWCKFAHPVKTFSDAIRFLKDRGGNCRWSSADVSEDMSNKLLDACVAGWVESIEYEDRFDGEWVLVSSPGSGL